MARPLPLPLARTDVPLAIVREMFGRRWRITRDELTALLARLALEGGVNLWRLDYSQPEQRQAPAWARAVNASATTFVSVCLCSDDSMHVRYDQPGTMHPMQMAEVSFVPAAWIGEQHDPIGYIRRHARRVLVVQE